MALSQRRSRMDMFPTHLNFLYYPCSFHICHSAHSSSPLIREKCHITIYPVDFVSSCDVFLITLTCKYVCMEDIHIVKITLNTGALALEVKDLEGI